MMDKDLEEFNRLSSGVMTDQVFDRLCEGEINSEEEFDFSDLSEKIDLYEKPVLLEGIVKRLKELGTEYEMNDTEGILSEIKRRYRERIGSSCPRTIQEWIRGTDPGDTNRINHYNLCYALSMDCKETAVFFLRYFLTVPFNYKDRVDAVFYYCLLHERPYSVIRKMLTESEKFDPAGQSMTETIEIRKRIREIDEDEMFMQYLSDHCYNNEQQYQRAREQIQYFLRLHNKTTMADLHEEIMGFNYQRDHAKKIRKEQERLKDKFPKEVLRSFPTDRTFLDILNGKKETQETLRKTLIILNFFDFYIKAENSMSEDPEDQTVWSSFFDFLEEVNGGLVQCGFPELYVRHPFDRLILFCARSRYPVVTFHALNDLRLS